ncbi:MAG: hypothetical protein AAF703_03485 [Cyanobacteria bacterium P01_D01_bin.105]
MAYLQLASLYHDSNPSQSDAYAQQALTAWNKAVALAPDNSELKAARDNLLAQIQNDE